MRRLENKIPPLLVMMSVSASMWLLSPLLPTVTLGATLRIAASLGIVVLALYFIAAGVLEFARHQTTVDPRQPEKTSHLVVSGIYKISRNPMYVGFALILTAQVILMQSPLLLTGVAAFVIYMNAYQITPEERAMKSHFGEQYARYMMQVRRWL